MAEGITDKSKDIHRSSKHTKVLKVFQATTGENSERTWKAATSCTSICLAGQALDLFSNALAGKVNVGEARLSMKAKAKPTDSIGYDDCDWDTPGLSSDLDTFTKNHCAGTVNCWQLTMGRLSRSGTIYSYERTKDSGYSQATRSDITVANDSYQRSQQSKEDKRMHLWMERKPRAPELNHSMRSNIFHERPRSGQAGS
ncbi:unnamed protein product [Calypogeia fissa]